MNPYTQFALLSMSTLRLVPHLLYYLAHRKTIDEDLRRYREGEGGVLTFIKVATRQRTFRNLLYYRMGDYRAALIKWLLPPDGSLHITCPQIGAGCHLEHAYSTYLNADSIGRNFYCLQLVTLGNGRDGRPVVGDDVEIYTGATVFGHVRIGHRAKIGAGSVVFRDVPDGCTVVGNPAVIVRRNGQEVHEAL